MQIILDTRRAYTTGPDSGKYPIKLRVNFHEYHGKKKKIVQKYFATGLAADKKEFESIMNSPRSERLKDMRYTLINLENKANDILKQNPVISPATFERLFTGSGSYDNALDLMRLMYEEFEEQGRAGNAIVYKNALSSFSKYGQLHFAAITPEWLMKYEKNMLKMGRSTNTIGMYLRVLRAVFNRAVSEKLVSADFYPFGRRKYVVPSATGRKIALTEKQKNVLLAANLPEHLREARDLWVFSYLSYGINFADMARLRFADIKENVILTGRKKTDNTIRNKRAIEIPLLDTTRAIIARWGNRSLAPGDYVFPVLRAGLTPKQERAKIQDWTKKVRKGLKEICLLLELPHVTTYTARHTFATIALRKGASKEFIQEALGHKSMMTTENYLSGFDFEAKLAISSRL